MWNASASSGIWTCVAVSISYDDNHYTTGTSLSLSLSHIYIYIYIYIFDDIYIYIYTTGTSIYIVRERERERERAGKDREMGILVTTYIQTLVKVFLSSFSSFYRLTHTQRHTHTHTKKKRLFKNTEEYLNNGLLLKLSKKCLPVYLLIARKETKVSTKLNVDRLFQDLNSCHRFHFSQP